MVRRAKFSILLFLVIFMGNAMTASSNSPSCLKTVDEITQTVAKEIERELKIIYIGEGGHIPQKIEAISLSFMAYRKPTLEEARDLEVKASEKLLSAINSNENIRSHLVEYPFTPNRATVSISFQKKDNTHYSDGSVALVHQVNNTIFYKREDPLTGRLQTIVKERYEEALKIVKSSKK